MSDIVDRLNDSLSAGYSELRKEAAAEITRLRARIAEMEKQEPVGEVVHNGESAGLYDILEQGALVYSLPGAQPAPVDDSATIAGLESAVTHLSVLLDSFRALLVEVNDVCGRDGHGGQLEDGESEIIDKVRAAISMTEAPPCAKGEEK